MDSFLNLETDRLRFRQWSRDDYPAVAEFFKDRNCTRFLGGIKNPEETWRLLAAYIGHFHLKGYSYPAIVERSTGQLVGSVGLWFSEPWPEPELGYWLLPDMQGKGYALEAGKALKSFAREVLKFDSLVSYTDRDNLPSVRTALKLGGKYDGTIQLLNYGEVAVYRYW